MPNRPWLEEELEKELSEVSRRLARSNLPRAYIRRFMDELTDHYHDFMEDNMSANLDAEDVVSRLGRADELAEAAVVSYKRQTFFGRHPAAKFWVFAVSPVVAMFATFVLVCLGVIVFGELCERFGVRLADRAYLGGANPATVNWTLSVLTIVIPAALLTVAYYFLARRLGISRRWMATSCGVLAFLAMLPIQNVLFSDIPGKSAWQIGFSFPPSLPQFVQLIVPLTVGIWLAWGYKKRAGEEGRWQMTA